MGDTSAAQRRIVVGHHVVWAVTAVGLVVAAWASAASTSAAPFLAPYAVALGWGAAGTQWSLAAGRVEREERPRGKPHPRSRRARGQEPPRALPPPWRWPVVLAYVVPVLVAVPPAPFVRRAEDPGVVLAVLPLAVAVGWLSGVCVALVLLFLRICAIGVAGFGRPLLTGEAGGQPVERAPFVGPFIATVSLLLLPVTLIGPLAYDSPYRRDVLPLLGVVRDGVDVEHPALLAVSQVATWVMVVGLLAGRIVHGAVGRRQMSEVGAP